MKSGPAGSMSASPSSARRSPGSNSSHLSHVRSAPALRLAEGYLLKGEIDAARRLAGDVLSASRTAGYRYLEGLAHRLLAECLIAEGLAADRPADAAMHAAEARLIFAAVDARNDLAKALMTLGRLARGRGEFATARELFEEAGAIFERLGTLDEPARVKAALAAIEG